MRKRNGNENDSISDDGVSEDGTDGTGENTDEARMRVSEMWEE